jgi:hypothetical protein
VLGGGFVAGDEGVEAQEREFGAREQLRCLREVGGFDGVELVDDVFEVFVGHGWGGLCCEVVVSVVLSCMCGGWFNG